MIGTCFLLPRHLQQSQILLSVFFACLFPRRLSEYIVKLIHITNLELIKENLDLGTWKLVVLH